MQQWKKELIENVSAFETHCDKNTYILVLNITMAIRQYYNVDMRTTFGFGLCAVGACVGETAPVLVLCVLVDSVSGVVLGVETFTIACVTVSVLFDLLFTFSIAFKLDRDDLCNVGSLI